MEDLPITRQVFSVSKWTPSTARDLSKAEKLAVDQSAAWILFIVRIRINSIWANCRIHQPADKCRESQSDSAGSHHCLWHFRLDDALAAGVGKAAAAIPQE